MYQTVNTSSKRRLRKVIYLLLGLIVVTGAILFHVATRAEAVTIPAVGPNPPKEEQPTEADIAEADIADQVEPSPQEQQQEVDVPLEHLEPPAPAGLTTFKTESEIHAYLRTLNITASSSTKVIINDELYYWGDFIEPTNVIKVMGIEQGRVIFQALDRKFLIYK